MRIFKLLFSRLFICFLVIAALVAAIIFLCVYIRSLLPAAAAVALCYFAGLFACAHILNGGMPNEFRCVWLSLIILLPPLGAALYLCTRTGKRSYSPCPPQTYHFERCEYFSDGAALLNRLAELIDRSQKSVLLEYYIIAKGQVWQGIYGKLKAALSRGVDVCVVYDGLGSALRAPERDLKKLQRMGAKVYVFNPPNPLRPTNLNTRDHRKCAVIDGRIVAVGGVNIADEYAHLTHPHAFWKDGGAVFYGAVAKAFEGEILNAYRKRKSADVSPVRPRQGDNGGAAKAVFDGEGSCFFEDAAAEVIFGAKRRVHIFTPYLCPGEKALAALEHAAREGADVKIIIPGVPDKKLPYAISRIYANRLMQSGAEVFLYTPGFMHFKGMVCDETAYLGSHNFDLRSLKSNLENGVFAKALAKDMEADFMHTLALCRPIKAERRSAAVNFFCKALCMLAPLM